MKHADAIPSRPAMPGVAIALLTLCLAACSKTAPPEPKPGPVPAKPAAAAAEPARQEPGSAPVQPPALAKEHEHALMQAIFGSTYDVRQEKALGAIQEEGTTMRTRHTFQAANVLPDGRTAVIVNSLEGSDEDEEFPHQATPGTLDVYLLRRNGTEWEVVEEYEMVDTLGSNGHIGPVTWLLLGDGKPGFMVASNGFGQGYSIDVANIFEIGDGVRGIGMFKLASDNGGACVPGRGECWDVRGTLRLADAAPGAAYRDLLVDFTGRHYTVTEDGQGKEVEHLRTGVRQTARYRFDGKEYVLAAGTNPVPDV